MRRMEDKLLAEEFFHSTEKNKSHKPLKCPTIENWINQSSTSKMKRDIVNEDDWLQLRRPFLLIDGDKKVKAG